MVTEGSTWTEEIVLGGKDDCCTLFLGGLCPRDREVCRVCAVMKFMKGGDWGGLEDMVFPVEGGGCGDSTLTQTLTPEESTGGNCPDGCMERVREVNAVCRAMRCSMDTVRATLSNIPKWALCRLYKKFRVR